MSPKEIKETLEIIESATTIIGFVVGGFWVYFRFNRTRENHPKIEFDVDLRVIGRQDNKIIIEVVANVTNKGLVRHWINNFTCNVLILKINSPVVHGDERINHQILFEKYNPQKQTDDPTGKQRIVWIPKDWYESYVDPGIKQQYTYLTDIPESTSFVSIYSHFYCKNNDFQTAQKTFSIEQLEGRNDMK